MRDVLRPVILRGWRELEAVGALSPSLSLEDLYLAVLVGAHLLEVRLRPSSRAPSLCTGWGKSAMRLGAGDSMTRRASAVAATIRSEAVPQSLLRGIVATVMDRYLGLRSLALASIRERSAIAPQLLARRRWRTEPTPTRQSWL